MAEPRPPKLQNRLLAADPACAGHCFAGRQQLFPDADLGIRDVFSLQSALSNASRFASETLQRILADARLADFSLSRIFLDAFLFQQGGFFLTVRPHNRFHLGIEQACIAVHLALKVSGVAMTNMRWRAQYAPE